MFYLIWNHCNIFIKTYFFMNFVLAQLMFALWMHSFFSLFPSYLYEWKGLIHSARVFWTMSSITCSQLTTFALWREHLQKFICLTTVNHISFKVHILFFDESIAHETLAECSNRSALIMKLCSIVYSCMTIFLICLVEYCIKLIILVGHMTFT